MSAAGGGGRTVSARLAGAPGAAGRDPSRVTWMTVYIRRTMTDLSPEQVRALAAAAGLPLTDDDLVEVTHRVNAFVEALAPVAGLPLDSVEPLPLTPE